MLERCPLRAPRRAAALAVAARLALFVKRFTASRSKLDFVRERLHKVTELFARRPATVPRFSPPPTLDAIWRMLGERYVPRRHAGRVTVLVSEEAQQTRTVTAADWSNLCRRADVRMIRGGHFTCVTDHIDETARTIAAALD